MLPPASPMLRNAISISVVIPVYNSATIFPVLYARLQEVLGSLTDSYTCIFVDDGSTDNSWAVISQQAAADQHCKALGSMHNCGQHAAIFAGLQYNEADYVVVMDDDLQDAPEDIPLLFQKVREGYDAVMCRRKTVFASPFRRLASSAFYIVLSIISRVRMFPGTANFGIYTKDVIDDILKKNTRYFFLPLTARRYSKVSGTIQVAHHPRYTGVSQYSFRSAWKLARNILRGSLRFHSAAGNHRFTVDRTAGI
ncbi:MAG: glycosyltransferase family 2 protein [Chitinophagales bacterium]